MSDNQYIDPKAFQELVECFAFVPTEASGKELAGIFLVLTRSCMKYAKFPKQGKITERNCVYSCFDNILKFDCDKGKAFNYFTTIILNKMRKEYRTWKKNKEREAKYKAFLA